MYKKEQYNQEIQYNIAVEILMDLVDLNLGLAKQWENTEVEILMDLVDLNCKSAARNTSTSASRSLWISWI